MRIIVSSANACRAALVEALSGWNTGDMLLRRGRAGNGNERLGRLKTATRRKVRTRSRRGRHRAYALGHPRRANETHAHPHAAAVAIVHNGIIENFRELRKRGARGRNSRPRRIRRPSPTDREGLSKASPKEAFRRALDTARGVAIAAIIEGEETHPLRGVGPSGDRVGDKKEMFLGLCAAVGPFTRG